MVDGALAGLPLLLVPDFAMIDLSFTRCGRLSLHRLLRHD